MFELANCQSSRLSRPEISDKKDFNGENGIVCSFGRCFEFSTAMPMKDRKNYKLDFNLC